MNNFKKKVNEKKISILILFLITIIGINFIIWSIFDFIIMPVIGNIIVGFQLFLKVVFIVIVHVCCCFVIAIVLLSKTNNIDLLVSEMGVYELLMHRAIIDQEIRKIDSSSIVQAENFLVREIARMNSEIKK